MSIRDRRSVAPSLGRSASLQHLPTAVFRGKHLVVEALPNYATNQASLLIGSAANHRLASLPMYDLPELHGAHDQLWTAIAIRLRERGVDKVPETLTRLNDLQSIWRNPVLLLSQTCGYPLVTALADQVQVVATPIYDAAGCAGTQHRSALIVPAASRAGDLCELRNGVCAVNSFDSNTGMNLLRAMIAPLARGKPFFAKVSVSGSHRQSVQMIAAGTADVAAIDCVTLALLQRVEPDLVSTIRVLEWSEPSPGLPFISGALSARSTVAALRSVLEDIAADPALSAVRAELLLGGFEYVPVEVYARVKSLEADALSQGYPRIR
jgi:ABC-type phosphate/phosphonate transport system substrate-binding protein